MIRYLRDGWLVILLALAFGAALAGVQMTLQPKIQANQLAETYEQIPKLVLGRDVMAGAAVDIDAPKITVTSKAGETIELQAEKLDWTTPDGEPFTTYRVTGDGGGTIGFVVRAEGQGYADKIIALIGLDPTGSTVLGVYVLDQKETPGLGSKIATDWNAQYAGKSATESIIVVKRSPAPGSQEVQAISGATISSNALTTIVNKAGKTFRTVLAARASQTAEEAADVE
jgi:electron transport complex protein RnfG